MISELGCLGGRPMGAWDIKNMTAEERRALAHPERDPRAAPSWGLENVPQWVFIAGGVALAGLLALVFLRRARS